MWRGIKQIITLKTQGICIPNKVMMNNHEITGPKEFEIANEFNNFSPNIGNKLASSIPLANKNFDYYLGKPQVSSFLLFPISALEIENVISTFNSSKACGPFSIPTFLLKTLKGVLSYPLEIIYNHSFESGTVHDQFKIAKVIPIHKKGSVHTISNYRPISLLSNFNKIIEKLIHNGLINYSI